MNRRVARRDFLVMAGAVAGTRSEAARAAPPVRERPTFVLVHGAWHSSYCWCEVANQLRLKASAARWGSVKRTYVHCTQDRAIAPALQLQMIADADRLTPGNRTDVIEMASSHSPFASQVDRLTALMRKLAPSG
jgi:hypothetical protein